MPNRTAGTETLPYASELVPAGLPEGIDGEAHVPFAELLDAHYRSLRLPSDYAESDDFITAKPAILEHGLYIRTDDSRFKTAAQLVIVSLLREPREKYAPGRNTGVVFNNSDFAAVGRTPLDGYQYPKNRENPEPSAETIAFWQERVTRKISGLESIQKRLLGERALLQSLRNNLLPDNRLVRYKAKNLEKKRAAGEELIHAMAEVAAINLNLGATALTGMHRAIHFNLYGYWGNAHPEDSGIVTADQVKRWRVYLAHTGSYTTAMIDRVARTAEVCRRSLAKHSAPPDPAEAA